MSTIVSSVIYFLLGSVSICFLICSIPFFLVIYQLPAFYTLAISQAPL